MLSQKEGGGTKHDLGLKAANGLRAAAYAMYMLVWQTL